GGGLPFLSNSRASGCSVSHLAPGDVLAGIGLGFTLVPVSIAALSGVSASQYGLASGLINTTQQIGGALGLAAASTIFTTRSTNLIRSGEPPPLALVHGFQLAFIVFAVVAFGAAAIAMLILRGTRIQLEHPEPAIAGTSPPG